LSPSEPGGAPEGFPADTFNVIGLKLDPYSFIVIGRKLIRSELNLIRVGNPITSSEFRAAPNREVFRLSLYEVLQVMSLRVVKEVVKALLKVVEVLKVLKLSAGFPSEMLEPL